MKRKVVMAFAPHTWIVLSKVMISHSHDSFLTSDRNLSGVSSLGSGGGEADAPSGLSFYRNRGCVAHLNLSAVHLAFSSHCRALKEANEMERLAFKYQFQRRAVLWTV